MIELSSKQLQRAAKIKGKIETLQGELRHLLGGGLASNDNTSKAEKPKKRTMSAAARARIGAAQKARWAKVKAGKK
jgi:hypothetical protein